jgi:hypothetical protein
MIELSSSNISATFMIDGPSYRARIGYSVPLRPLPMHFAPSITLTW